VGEVRAGRCVRLESVSEKGETNMPPKPFYEIDAKSYLFGKSLVTGIEENREPRKTPEEKVRQWVLFELLSTYGYHINDIRIEVPAKMGSGYHPADIVIYKEHQPYIVFECKKQGSNKADEAIKQMITYATGLKTTFAVYVDGQNWMVKRFFSGHWVDVHDIPQKISLTAAGSVSPMFWFVAHIRPLLFWAYKTVPAKHAQKFFEHLDTFTYFIGFSYVREINHNLHFGTNGVVKLIRQILSERSNTPNLAYKKKNLAGALSFFQKYLADIDSVGYLINNLDLDNRTFEDAVEAIFVELNTTVLNLSDVINKEVAFLRFTVSLLHYLKAVLKNPSYISIESFTTNDLYFLINLVLITEFGIGLPDHLDTDNTTDLEAFSSEYWIESN
jgi:Holliday junction resolvase